MFVALKTLKYSKNLSYFKIRLLTERMIQETDIIPEYLINLMTLTHPPKHTGQF